MTWEPKNGLNDEDVDVSDEEENDTSFKEEKSRTGETIFCNCARRCIRTVLGEIFDVSPRCIFCAVAGI